MFPQKFLKSFVLGSVKNAVDNLKGIALNL